MAHPRRSVAAILVASLALGVASAGPGLAKSPKPPFKAGRYGGTVTSNVSGHEPASRSAKLKISKVGKGYRLRMTLSVRVTCNNKGQWRKLPFGGVHIDKTTRRLLGEDVAPVQGLEGHRVGPGCRQQDHGDLELPGPGRLLLGQRERGRGPRLALVGASRRNHPVRVMQHPPACSKNRRASRPDWPHEHRH